MADILKDEIIAPLLETSLFIVVQIYVTKVDYAARGIYVLD